MHVPVHAKKDSSVSELYLGLKGNSFHSPESHTRSKPGRGKNPEKKPGGGGRWV